MTTPSDGMAQAIAYAAQRWLVMPLRSIRKGSCTCGKADCSSPGKHPCTARGLKDASIDLERIREWWRKWPEANIAVVTGAVSGIVAFDIDPRHGGKKTLDQLEAEHGTLPATVTAVTGGGGFHFIYRHPGEPIKNRTNLFPGIDVRGDGGYIVVAPSNHLSGGNYCWDEGRAPGEIPLAAIPTWLLEVLRRGPRREQRKGTPIVGRELLMQCAQEYVAHADSTCEGHRNDAAFNLAGHLAAFVDKSGGQLHEQEIADLMRPWNLRLFPPLSETELGACVRSGMNNGKPRDPKLVTARNERNGTSPQQVTRQPLLVNMSEVEARPTQWLWPNRIAKGRITLAVGMPGVGKSFLTCDLASRVSTGTSWPDGTACPKGSTIIISAEDDPHDTIRPRLDAHRADVRRIHLLSSVIRTEEDGRENEMMFSLSDLDALEIALQRLNDCQLIVVDPIGSFLGGRTDAHRDNEVRAVLTPVAKLAEKYGPAVLIVAHRRKSGGGIADDLALGSRAFTGLARSVWHLCTDSEDKHRRLFLTGKNNLAAQQQGLAFTICGEPAAVHWERDPVAMTADEALAHENGGKCQGTAVGEAVAWLEGELADGPRPGREVKDAARAAGIALRTLDRAKAKLGVITGPDGFGGSWVWRLPGSDRVRQEFPECAKEKNLAHSGESGALCGDQSSMDCDREEDCTIQL